MAVAIFIGLAILGAVAGTPKKNDAAPTRGARSTVGSKQPGGRSNHTAATSTGPSGAQLVVARSGFSQDARDISYGVTLVNRGTSDAAQVLVKVRVIDKLGRSSATDQTPVSFIPAGGRFNVAGLIEPNIALKAAKLKVSVRWFKTAAQAEHLPVVASVRVGHNDFGLIAVRGTLKNPGSGPLSGNAPIYIVFLDRAGHVIDASSETTGAAIEPHASVPFHVDAVVNDKTRPASAVVSVDACTYVHCLATGLSMQFTTTGS